MNQGLLGDSPIAGSANSWVATPSSPETAFCKLRLQRSFHLDDNALIVDVDFHFSDHATGTGRPSVEVCIDMHI
jgi:hypothetical protein